jgi:DMSO/TMAO reductase YedYZ heme-binding membrane subunit
MTDLLWYLTRATGIVALVLMVAAVADGLIFSGRNGGRHLRPAWWMDLHRGLGGYALACTGLHLATAFGADIGVGVAELFVPGAATVDATAYTLGVVATYVLALTVITSWPRRRLPRRLWHVVHLLSVPAAGLAGVHAYRLGADARAPLYLGLCCLTAGAAVYPLGLRLTGLAGRGRRPSTAGLEPPA